MNAYKFVTLIVVSVLVAILLASALNNFTRVSDSALADIVPTSTSRTNAPAAKTPVKREYLPIVLLNPTISTSWLLNGNSSTNYLTNFLGTTDNVTLTVRVSNTVAFRIAPVTTTLAAGNIIGGYGGNSMAPGVFGSTIGGGGGNVNADGVTACITCSNVVSATYATVSGGYANTISASGVDAAIGGGRANTASNPLATIGGG